jgi:hypothetical protein
MKRLNDVVWMALTLPEAQKIWDELSGAEKDVLIQLTIVTWDGNLASKQGRSDLVVRGLATKYEGYQVISHWGLILLTILNKFPKAVTR